MILRIGANVGRVRAHTRNGRPVRSYTRRNPGRKVVGVTVAATVAVGGIAATATIYSSSAGSAASSGVGSEGLSKIEVSAESGTDFKGTAAVLTAAGYSVSLDISLGSNCFDNSYGQVHNFFKTHPCKWLARAYLAVGGDGDGVILVAISWVDMRSVSLAQKYKRLVDRSGTGNVTELSRDSGPYKNVRFSGDFYISGIGGTSVWNAQAQPVVPTPTAVINKILNASRQPT
jgi:hypothetical protein